MNVFITSRYACRKRNSERPLVHLNVICTWRFMPAETEFFLALTCTPEHVYRVTLYACRDRNSERSLALLNVFITSRYMTVETEIQDAH